MAKKRRARPWTHEYKVNGFRQHRGQGVFAIQKYWEPDLQCFNFAVSKTPKRKVWYWSFDNLDKAKRFARDWMF